MRRVGSVARELLGGRLARPDNEALCGVKKRRWEPRKWAEQLELLVDGAFKWRAAAAAR